jgi:hypothetical protein
MVPFAGYDPTEDAKISPRAVKAAKMFEAGFDTISIKMTMGITEAQALRLVSIGRSHFLGLPSPYQGRG